MKYKEMLAFAGFLNKSHGTNTEEWKKAMQSINQLMEMMGPYQLPNGDKTYRPISPQAYERIEATFDQAVADVSAFVKTQANGPEDEARMQLMKNFNKEFLAKSYIEYKNVKPNPNESLRDAMEHFRYQNVEVSDEQLRRLGANLSSRIQLSIDLDGVNTRGVFTKRTSFEPRAQYSDLLGEMGTKYGKFDSFWKALDDTRFFERGFPGVTALNFMRPETGVVYDENPQRKEQAMNNFAIITTMDNYPAIGEEFEKYRNDPDFFNALLDFSLKGEQLIVSRGINEQHLGIKPGENIDGRNSAMSSVANLLGVNDLIAKSQQVAVHMPDGSFETGTFMEFVESKDISHIDSIDEMRVAGLDAYEAKEVKVQLANLQVLDYICGNVDRHTGNILYKFDPQTHKLASIKGIDNDASFLRRRLNNSEGIAQLCSIRQMRVIDEDMAQKLLQIDEGMLTATLHGYGLSEEEIASAYDRLHNLQEAIHNAPTYDPKAGLPPYEANGEGHGITIVKKEDWEKLSLNDLSVGNNDFAKLVNVQRFLTTSNMVTSNLRQNAECSKRSLKAMLGRDNTKGLLDQALRHKPFMGVSQRYQNVLSAMEAYQNAPAPEDPLHSEGDAKWDRLADLKAAVDAYKREKIGLGHLNADGTPTQEMKGKALSRIEDVDRIGKFADKLLEQRKQALDADRALHEAERKQGELDAFKALSPEEQQIILDQKRAHEELLNQDLSVRLQNSLAADEEAMDDYSEVDVSENLSVDAMNPND